MTKNILREILQWVQAIVIAIVIAILIRGFLFEPVIVDGSSMQTTLQHKDRVILNKITLAFNDIERGDIVVLEINAPEFRFFKFLNGSDLAKKLLPTFTEVDYIKRVVAIGGDVIDIKDNHLYINGTRQEEEYIKFPNSTRGGATQMPHTVPEDHYFVMGDNRTDSQDSRVFGSVPKDKIIGKTILRIWPLDKFGKIDRR
ncbi:MAG: signal peptidase I [Clostridia bacterium]